MSAYLSREPISVDALIAQAAAPECGGTCLFLGTVRNGPDESGVAAIEYTAYDDMADAELQRIVADALPRRPSARIALRHRLGDGAGGEPLLRHELATLVAMLDRVPGLKDLALTTNGLLLAREAERLRRAGLARVTVSLDTLRPERMREFAKSAGHDDVVAGIQAARQVGFQRLKLNTVVVRGFNDDELADLIEFGRSHDAEVRFIEYMDVGGATRWTADQVVPQREILERLTRRYGPVESVGTPESPAAPAVRFRLPDGTVFGVIASVTGPFCGSCDRSRLTADGTWFLCLYAAQGVDLREPLRPRAP